MRLEETVGRSSNKQVGLPENPVPQPNRFVMVVDGNEAREERGGWLTADPGTIRSRLIDFRRKKLRG
jgi:hypothetical protein